MSRLRATAERVYADEEAGSPNQGPLRGARMILGFWHTDQSAAYQILQWTLGVEPAETGDGQSPQGDDHLFPILDSPQVFAESIAQ
jgi:hypothetical protein